MHIGCDLPGQQETPPLRCRSEDFPIHQASNELLCGFPAGRSIPPRRQNAVLNLGRREVVLQYQQTTDDLSDVPEERVRQSGHPPMQPNTFLSGNAREKPNSYVPKHEMLRGNATPDTKDDPGCFGSRLYTRKFFPQLLIQELAQLRLVGRLGEMIQRGIEPGSFDPLRDSDD